MTHRERTRSEMDEEMRFHLDMEVGELVRDGMDPEEAHRLARVRFGGVERFKQEAREARGLRPVEDLLQDLRYVFRGLRRAPGFAAAAVLTLGLGISGNTAIFSLVDGVLLKPLAYPESERLVRLFQQSGGISNRWGLSAVDYLAVEAQQSSFDRVAALRAGEVTLTGAGEPERIRVGFVTADWFSTLGLLPTEGRGFRQGEDRPGAERVVVISHAFRERHFGVETDVLGQSLVLDGDRYSVVGVLPAGVRSLAGWGANIWPVLQLNPPTRRGPFFLRVIARLRSGASLKDATRDLAGISERVFPVWADTFQDREARLTPVPLREVIIGDVGGALLLLLGAVGFVLLIAVTNVANLMLARATVREREVALRTSLGATRGRLLRQLLVESATVASLGGLVGLALSAIALDALVGLGPQLPRLDEVHLDGRVLGFTALVTIGSGLLCGLAPLLYVRSPDLAGVLRSGGRAGSDGKRSSVLRGALVAAEFALALPLLVGAALLFTSLERLQGVDVGFDPENILLARSSLPASRYPDAESVQRFWDSALREIAGIPGVAAVGIGSGLPPDDSGNQNNFDLLDKPVAPGTTQPAVPWLSVTPGFFDALDVRLLDGRIPDASDGSDDPLVAAVSQSWAARFYPGETVLGKQMYGGGNLTQATTVVGVVGDVKYLGLASLDDAAVYVPYTQARWRSVNLVVRTRAASVSMAQVRDRLSALDPDLPLSDVQTMEQRLASSVQRPRTWATLVGVFAAVGLTLAAVGIYGVLSYFVSRQQRDIGIRMALGASAGSVRRLVLRRGLSRAALGLVAGLAAGLFLTKWLEGLLFEVSPTDPLTFGGVSLILLGVALGACYGPARRATRVDPVRVLVEE